MPSPAGERAIKRGRDAAARRDWQEAYAILSEADVRRQLTGPELSLLAEVAYAAGHLDVTVDAWERTYTAALRAGDDLAAAGAAVRVAMHLLFDTALLAPVRAWLGRAEKLLQRHDDPTPVHAWLAVVRNYERMLSGDFESARRLARRAIEAGTGRDEAAATIGRVAEGRLLILAGEVTDGLRSLNEAAIATSAGAIDPLSTGVVFCEVICAFQSVGQFDLAEQWTAVMERWHPGRPVGSVHGRCRVHRAEILRLRGACADAESEVLRACDELRPYLRREFGWPLAELGRIRFRRGDLKGAEAAFRQAHDVGWDPHPGLALVHLAKGEVSRAAITIRDAINRPAIVPSKEWPPNSQLRRAPLLEAKVEIDIAASDLGSAKTAADELEQIAERFQSSAFAASALLSRARVRLAEGDLADACIKFDAAAERWSEVGAPYEQAVARAGLGRALVAAGHAERGRLELQTAAEVFDRIGAALPPAYAAEGSVIPDEIRGNTGSVAVASVDRPPIEANAFCWEGDCWSITFDGRLTRVRDARGLSYLARLLATPQQEHHVLDLVDAVDPGQAKTHGRRVTDAGDSGPLLDARAKAAYRRRLKEIEDDLTEAAALGDAARMTQGEAERDLLIRELARAVGLGGRDRRAGVASERARSAATRAVRLAISRIRRHNPALADHFDRTIRTGTYCAYLPDPRTASTWKT